MSKLPPRINRPPVRRPVRGRLRKKGLFEDEEHKGKDLDDLLDRDVLDEDKDRETEHLQQFYREARKENDAPGQKKAREEKPQKPKAPPPKATPAPPKGTQGKKPQAPPPGSLKELQQVQRAREASINQVLAKLEKSAQANESRGLTPPPVKGSHAATTAMGVLHNAKEPGYFYRERDAKDGGGNGQEKSPEDTLVDGAVEDAKKSLEGVTGIARVFAGLDEESHPRVVVVATKGFGRASLKKVPEQVREVETLIAIPYDLLPLKRDPADAPPPPASP